MKKVMPLGSLALALMLLRILHAPRAFYAPRPWEPEPPQRR
jgi:hypothetical protein